MRLFCLAISLSLAQATGLFGQAISDIIQDISKIGDGSVATAKTIASQQATSGSLKYRSTKGNERKTFSGTYTPPALPPDKKGKFLYGLALFSDDGCDVTVHGNKVHAHLGLNQHLPDIDASFYPLPVALAPGKPATVTVDYSNTIYVSTPGTPGYPDIDGCTLFLTLLPFEVAIIHTEKERDDNGNELSTTVSPGKDTLLGDEISDLRIKIPPLGNADWDLKLDLEPSGMKTQALGGRGAVQMYDFGKVENGVVTPLTTEANGATKAGPYDITLLASKGGDETFRIVVNKEGKFKLRLKTADNEIDVTSQEFTVTKRIRKYGKDNASTTYDFNKHDKHFENAAASWGAFYQHHVDDVERLKAIGMTESELGRNPQNSSARPDDIMTIGHPDDHVLDTLRFVSGHQEKEVDPQNKVVRDMNYPQAAASPAGTAIHWGTCWLYHKAQTIANNPRPPPSLIPGPWRSWDDATTRYNGGGVNNYLDRVTRAFIEGRHPTDQTTVWPLLTNGRARK